MTRAREDRLLSLLQGGDGWSTAAVLAERLGVTPRSVRAYVAALNARVPGEAVESGPLGYRAGPDAAASLRRGDAAASPRDRLHTLVRSLLDAPGGVDVRATATRLHVSGATLDGDLGRVRALLAGSDVALVRSGAIARLDGGERAQRRLLSRLAHDELDASGPFDAEGVRRILGESTAPAPAFEAFRADLVAGLGTAGYAVNEIGMDDVLLHIAIAADRIARDRPLDTGAPSSPSTAPVGELLERLAVRHLGIRLTAADRDHLAALVLSRVAALRDEGADRLDPAVARAVRDVVRRAAEEYGVDVDDEDFAVRLALHVQHLLHRSRDQAWSRNPLTASLKSTHPMIFEVAVYVAAGLRDELGIPLPDDEIAYLAMHIGGHLERGRRAEPLPTAVVVAPGYHDLPELLRASVERALERVVDVVGVTTRADAATTADLVLTTDPAAAGDDRAVRITPFLTDADVVRVQAAAARVRRARRLARLRDELTRYLDEAAFVHGVTGTPDDVIRRLGALLVAQGVIDDEYVARTIEREALSSTAFTDTLAVPHALTMTATRTSIAIGIADPPLTWGGEAVRVVAMVAFSESDRAAFQTVLEQFVEVFADPAAASRIVRRATTFAGFVDELVAVIDG